MTVRGGTYRALLEASRSQLRTDIAEDVAVFCEEHSYKKESELRRAARCFDEQRSWNYCDSESGAEVSSNNHISYILRFLQPSSPLPSIPNRQPHVFIFTSCDLLAVAPDRQLQAAPQNAWGDRAFGALVRGVSSEGRIFLQGSRGYFCDSESGKGFQKGNIPGHAKRHFFLLLRDGSPVPRIAAPEIGYLLLYARAGLVVRVRGDRFRREGGAAEDSWRQVKDNETFYKEFVAAAGK